MGSTILIETSSSPIAGATGIEIGCDCFQEKSTALAYLLLSLLEQKAVSWKGW